MGLIVANDRELALCYAHMIYRNTEVEDYHSQGVVMGDDFYSIVYRIVSKQIRRIKRNQKIAIKINTLDACAEMLQSMYYPRAKELHKYILDVYYTIKFQFGSAWDPAKTLETEYPKDAAEYILSGRFKECCERHQVLDDKTMAYINRDVHDRIYTLVSMKYFGENFET